MTDSIPSPVSTANPQRLARLLGLSPRAEWSAADLAALWRLQRTAPLTFDLPGAEPSAGPVDPAFPTLAALWHHPQPPLDLLVRGKDWAKAWRAVPELPLPDEIGALVYFVCILLARARHGAAISSLDTAGLSAGAAWVVAQPWLDDDTRGLALELKTTL